MSVEKRDSVRKTKKLATDLVVPLAKIKLAIEIIKAKHSSHMDDNTLNYFKIMQRAVVGLEIGVSRILENQEMLESKESKTENKIDKKAKPIGNNNTINIYKAAILISIGYTFIASIFSLYSLGLLDFSDSLAFQDDHSIAIMFFGFSVMFSIFILIIFTNLNKLVKNKENEVSEKDLELAYFLKA